MYWFNFNDFRFFERPATSPCQLNEGISALVYSSINTRAKVDSINPETGEYRIVLQGTLDMNHGFNTDRY
jgi:hypothetical protein